MPVFPFSCICWWGPFLRSCSENAFHNAHLQGCPTLLGIILMTRRCYCFLSLILKMCLIIFITMVSGLPGIDLSFTYTCWWGYSGDHALIDYHNPQSLQALMYNTQSQLGQFLRPVLDSGSRYIVSRVARH